MIPHSRQLIHAGINFVFSPSAVLDADSRLGFQGSLERNRVVPQRVEFSDQQLLISAKAPTELELRIGALGDAPVGQLLIVSTRPGTIEVALEQSELVTKAFEEIWPLTTRQLIRIDATLRVLFETSDQHAFVELWSSRLKQPVVALERLGRPVLGGGLRFVMPPTQPGQALVEVKIESFLQDVRKIFVETQFVWEMLGDRQDSLDASAHLKQVSDYVDKEVVSFMTGDK